MFSEADFVARCRGVYGTCLAPKALCHTSPPQDGFAVANLGRRPRNLIAKKPKR